MFLLLQISTVVPNVLVSATDGMDDIDDLEFVGLSPEKMQIIYEISSEPDNTYSSNIFYYDHFMESYFDNLTMNHGYNIIGSCGYVGIDMLLSYYDTYLSDNIVPEQYDKISEGNCYNMLCRRNSPGSIYDNPKDFTVDYSNKSTSEIYQINASYYNYVEANKNVSFKIT